MADKQQVDAEAFWNTPFDDNALLVVGFDGVSSEVVSDFHSATVHPDFISGLRKFLSEGDRLCYVVSSRATPYFEGSPLDDLMQEYPENLTVLGLNGEQGFSRSTRRTSAHLLTRESNVGKYKKEMSRVAQNFDYAALAEFVNRQLTTIQSSNGGDLSSRSARVDAADLPDVILEDSGLSVSFHSRQLLDKLGLLAPLEKRLRGEALTTSETLAAMSAESIQLKISELAQREIARAGLDVSDASMVVRVELPKTHRRDRADTLADFVHKHGHNIDKFSVRKIIYVGADIVDAQAFEFAHQEDPVTTVLVDSTPNVDEPARETMREHADVVLSSQGQTSAVSGFVSQFAAKVELGVAVRPAFGPGPIGR